jgi:DNA repair protein RadA/Sms
MTVRGVRFLKTIDWFDKVLGQGVAAPSITLIGGAPGAGRTVMLLQLLNALATAKTPSVYLSTEQGDTTATIERLQLETKRIRVDKIPTDANHIIEATQWADRAIEGISAFGLDALGSLAPSNMTRIVCEVKALSIKHKIPTFIVMYMTKSHDFVGPMDIQHTADVLMTLYPYDDNRTRARRELMVWKNSFAPLQDKVDLEMTETGLKSLEGKSC